MDLDKVKYIREATGAGLLDCKRAFVNNKGDVDKAIAELRIKGAKLSKTKDRDATNGAIFYSNIDGHMLLHVCCETDFVAKSDKFYEMATTIMLHLSKFFSTNDKFDILTSFSENDLNQMMDSGVSIKDYINGFISQIGEPIILKQVFYYKTDKKLDIGCYLHKKDSTLPAQKASLVILDNKGNDNHQYNAYHIAQHVVATGYKYETAADIPDDIIKEEKEIILEQNKDKALPERIINNIIAGKMKSFMKENVLIDQMFIMDNSKTVNQIIDNRLLVKVVHFIV